MTRMTAPFRVGTWLIEPGINRLSKEGESVKLEPKVMDVLVQLSARPGQVVSRDELFETVWAGTVVTDDALTRSISELRKVFGDDPKRPSFIETIPKAGYRIIAPIVRQHAGIGLTPEQDSGLVKRPRLQAIITGVVVAVLVIVAIVLTQSSIFQPAPTAYHPQPVTTDPGREGPPELSPDGRQVAFGWSGEEGNNLDIYVKYVDAGPALRLTDHKADDFNPAWSPEGSEIAFLRWEDGGCSIYIVSALGGEERRLAACGQTIYGDLTWSPRGRWLAINDRDADGQSYAIYLVEVQNLEKTRLTNPPNGIWGDHDPVFSPDETRVAFVRSRSEGMQDVYVFDIEGGTEQRATNESRNIWGVTWSSNGRSLIFSSNRAGRPGIWRVSPDGGVPAWVGVGTDAATFPSIAGGNLAFLRGSDEVNIWSLDVLPGSEAKPVIRSTYWDMHPSISPDGSRLAFTSNRSGSYELWVSESDGANPVRLTSFGDTFISTPRWSSDGRKIVFTARPNGHADLYRIDSDGGDLTRLTNDESDDLAASWATDGSRVLFTSNRTGDWQIWSITSSGQGPTQITTSGGYGPQESARGSSIYFAKVDEPGLWRVDEDDGSIETQVDSTLDPRDWGSFVVGDGLIHLLQRGRPTVIARLDLDSGRYDTLHVPAERVPSMDPAMSVSRNADRFFFGQVDRREADIMWVEGIDR